MNKDSSSYDFFLTGKTLHSFCHYCKMTEHRPVPKYRCYLISSSKFLLFENFRTMVSIRSGCPPLNFIVPICCFVYHSRRQIPCTSLPSPWQTGHTLAQFPLLSYSHVNVLKLTLVCCNLLHRSSYKYASKRSSYIAIQSSCFSLETEHFLKCAKGV